MKNRQGGLNKFDFLIVVIIFGVLAATFLARMDQLQGEAERTQVDMTIRNIRVGMQLAVGELVMLGKDDQIRLLLRSNPFRFLEKLPEGYEGEAAVPSRPGGWVYDSNRSELAYQPKLKSAFDGRDSLRWRFQSVAASTDKLAGLRLIAVE